MDNIDLNKPLFQCTLGEFKAVIVEALCDKKLEDIAAKAPKRYVYGLSGLTKLLGCSISTAERIKQSGVIDEAISQTGDIIVTDAELALDLLRVSHKYRKYSKPKQTESTLPSRPATSGPPTCPPSSTLSKTVTYSR